MRHLTAIARLSSVTVCTPGVRKIDRENSNRDTKTELERAMLYRLITARAASLTHGTMYLRVLRSHAR